MRQHTSEGNASNNTAALHDTSRTIPLLLPPSQLHLPPILPFSFTSPACSLASSPVVSPCCCCCVSLSPLAYLYLPPDFLCLFFLVLPICCYMCFISLNFLLLPTFAAAAVYVSLLSVLPFQSFLVLFCSDADVTCYCLYVVYHLLLVISLSLLVTADSACSTGREMTVNLMSEAGCPLWDAENGKNVNQKIYAMSVLPNMK